MKKQIVIFLFSVFFISASFAGYSFVGSEGPIPEDFQKEMIGKSWHSGCPVNFSDLAYLRVSYWGFDGKVHVGELITHKIIAKDAVSIFKELFDIKYKIEKIILPEDVKQGMDTSNFSYAFYCRADSQTPSQLSMHSFGLAIDLNPLYNPAIDGENVIPDAGRKYLDRRLNNSSMIKEGDPVFMIFTRHGWRWGGFFNQADYMHFDKGTAVHNQYMIERFKYLPEKQRIKSLPR